MSKERERERASSSSFRASFSPKGRGITQRTARAVTSFLRTVYNVLSTRVASFLAFRCIINEHVSPCTVAHTSDHLPLPRVEEGCAPSSDRQPPFSSRSLSPPPLSSLLLPLLPRARLSPLVCRLSFEAYNEMRKRDGGIHRWPNRGDSLTKGNPICT